MIPQFRPVLKAGFWTPLSLGTDLIEWLDAEQPAQFNTPTGAITTWTDSVLSRGYTQATGANQPTRSTTSFNGRPGVTFDGTNDELTCPNTTGIPTGGTAFWRWAVIDQQVLAADTANKTIWGIGNASTTAALMQRRVTAGVNRAFGSLGTGISTATCTETTINFSGRKLFLWKYGGTGLNQQAIVSQTAGTAVAGSTSTTTTRATVGASPDSTRTLPWAGIVNTMITTKVLTAPNEALMNAYLAPRYV